MTLRAAAARLALCVVFCVACQSSHPGEEAPDAVERLDAPEALEELSADDAEVSVEVVDSDASTRYQGGFHPPPPSDLPPIPAPPSDFGPAFIALDDGLEQDPWPLFRGDDDDIPSPTSALFGDLDGDGRSEVIFSSGRRGLQGGSQDIETLTSRAFRVDPESEVLVPMSEHPLPIGHILSLNDLDGDGRDDILTLGPSTVHWGGEELTVSPVLEAAGGDELLHYKALSLADVDADGLIDLVAQPVSCCTITCPELTLVLQRGRRHFEARPGLIETVNHANVCATLMAPLGSERLLMSFAAVGACGGRSHLFYREVGKDQQGMPRFEAFEAAGETPTLELTLSSPMGASVGDLDGDGDFDLTMTTDPYHVVLRAEEAWPLSDLTTWTGVGSAGLLLPPEPLGPDRYMIPWGAALLDLDRDGRLDIVYSHGADPNPGGDKPELEVGPQHVSAHWNGGQMRFADVTQSLGLDELGEWRALTVGDLDADGDPDLGVGGLGHFPRVYRNAVESSGKGLAIRLRGTTSNALGLGAVVHVKPSPDAPEQVHLMGHIGNPYGVSQALIFVGLGDVDAAQEVRVTWPSGLVQRVNGLSASKLHTLMEPSTIEVSPWSRRLEAAGDKSAFIEVKGRDIEGALVEGASLELVVLSGQAELAGPGVPHEGGRRWELLPPGAPGESRLEARIDGVPVEIRPRVVWY